MDIVIEAGSGGVDVGSYHAEFIAAEHLENQHGHALRLSFKTADSETATRIVGLNHIENSDPPRFRNGPKSNVWKFWKMFAGGVDPTDSLDFDRFAGTSGMIVVGQAPSGDGTRVESFLRDA